MNKSVRNNNTGNECELCRKRLNGNIKSWRKVANAERKLLIDIEVNYVCMMSDVADMLGMRNGDIGLVEGENIDR